MVRKAGFQSVKEGSIPSCVTNYVVMKMVKKKMTFVISVLSETGAKILRKTYERCGYEYVGHTKDDNVIFLEFKDKDI